MLLSHYLKFSKMSVWFLPHNTYATHMHSAVQAGVRLSTTHQYCIKMAQQTELVFSNFQLCYKGIQVLKNVGQCPTWWSPCRIYMAPSVQRRKVWLTPTTRCRAVMLPRRETSWNLQGSPKLVNRSHPLVGRSSPYCGDMWRTYCCLTSFFFRLSIRALVAKI